MKNYWGEFLVTIVIFYVTALPFHGAVDPDPDPCVRQSRDLSFVEEAHRSILVRELNTMSHQIDETIERFTDAGIMKTLLCNATLMMFMEDGTHEFLRATRDWGDIKVNAEEDRSKPKRLIIIRCVPHEVFSPSDRKHHGFIFNKAGRLAFKHNRGKPYRLADCVRYDLISKQIPKMYLQFNRTAEGNSKSQLVNQFNLDYINSHYDDAEGQAVDRLAHQLQLWLWEYSHTPVRRIYSLFCTGADPCRCCLISIRDYLITRIRELFHQAKKPIPELYPIVVSRAVFPEWHPPIQYALFRRFYRWCDPPAVLPVDADLAGDAVADVGAAPIQAPLNWADVVARGRPAAVRAAAPTPTILYLCRMGILSELPPVSL
jgi:hypothetical protein